MHEMFIKERQSLSILFSSWTIN